MLAGQIWILLRAWLTPDPVFAAAPVARVSEIPVGGVKLFRYPGPHDPCIMIRTGQETFVAYSQKCTHLSCAVHYAADRRRIECPCHEGYFAVETGEVLQGPPPRPLPRILLRREDDVLTAVGVALQPDNEA
jgi:Rieske Fe-S protein